MRCYFNVKARYGKEAKHSVKDTERERKRLLAHAQKRPPPDALELRQERRMGEAPCVAE